MSKFHTSTQILQGNTSFSGKIYTLEFFYTIADCSGLDKFQVWQAFFCKLTEIPQQCRFRGFFCRTDFKKKWKDYEMYEVCWLWAFAKGQITLNKLVSGPSFLRSLKKQWNNLCCLPHLLLDCSALNLPILARSFLSFFGCNFNLNSPKRHCWPFPLLRIYSQHTPHMKLRQCQMPESTDPSIHIVRKIMITISFAQSWNSLFKVLEVDTMPTTRYLTIMHT